MAPVPTIAMRMYIPCEFAWRRVKQPVFTGLLDSLIS